MLVFYDLILLVCVDLLMLVIYPSGIHPLTKTGVIAQFAMSVVAITSCRILGGIYKQIWRYGGTSQYIRLILSDAAGGAVYLLLMFLLPFETIAVLRALTIVALDLLAAIAVRLMYQYMYEYNSLKSPVGKFMRRVTRAITGIKIDPVAQTAGMQAAGNAAGRRINIAIVGAGRVGVMLAEELLKNPAAAYQPCCFIDIDSEKIGRYISGLRVFAEAEVTSEVLASFPIQEIVFAMPDVDTDRKQQLYKQYKATGCKIKVYDYPDPQKMGSKRTLREFDITELLFRQQVEFMDEQTKQYYRGKTVLISGGGGSIGSELCRQIAKMQPKRLVILDVYENGAYDIQQELRIRYGAKLDLVVEIATVCDREALDRIFAEHKPDVVLHAAAHKHVPLMERNCVEAVKNNVFGTLNIVEASEKHGVGKFTMISTDKAVNPTNVMGATKRMCEMIVQSRTGTRTNFSATRFGNVLGSNGSVIPLFKRQIMNGGPVTLTDKRIIRYFMTIPEASQLVLQSGAMAKNGELYVLDMGKPVKILELAENMIRLSGFEPYKDIDIVETGLRPGEKLYEELLIKTEELDKTSSSMIFVERDKPETMRVIAGKLERLNLAVESGDDEAVRAALHEVVPTFKTPEEINAEAGRAEEMQMTRGAAAAG
ncbi:MAG: polysaccharide biosynthesis protein [Clostridia bacterium]|nr:polysaccharide biosynthesis protein [Clostridia bacterium]